MQHAARQFQPQVLDCRVDIGGTDMGADFVERGELFFKCGNNRWQDRKVRCRYMLIVQCEIPRLAA
jgi:hypothetical protein